MENIYVEVKIPPKLRKVLDEVKRKDRKLSYIKIYNSLVRKSKYSDDNGWFEIPANYMRKINGRYKAIIEHLVKENIIEYHTKEYYEDDLFEPVIKKSYNIYTGECMKYRFLIDIDEGHEIEIKIPNSNYNSRWYQIIKQSLSEFGMDKISRDGFTGRVYHGLIKDYKSTLSGRGYSVIDSISSQPRLLYLKMREDGIIDPRYFDIFESEKDIYIETSYLSDSFEDGDRDSVKKTFMFWTMGEHINSYELGKIYPIAHRYLRNMKRSNFKRSSRTLATIERKIFIDDLMENLPVSFGIPIHDSIIVKDEDVDVVLDYCETKYPDLRFGVENI